jgi:phosphatidylinositol alpha 1,6-mannosyltransferase
MPLAADRPSSPLRVAYFPDSFHEVNGVAHTSRHFQAYAARHGLPFLCVRAGSREKPLLTEGSVTSLELPRSGLPIALDKDLRLDPLFLRHWPAMLRALRDFRPDIIHITGPSEIGLLGAALADHLGVPMSASWHTNVHEYAAKRSLTVLRHLPMQARQELAGSAQEIILRMTSLLYSWACVTFAPNVDLCRLLEMYTHRPCRLMQRGVDTNLFSPGKRSRTPEDGELVLGFTGRLSVEKNIALLAQVQQELESRGNRSFRFLIIGQGTEEAWLRDRLPRAEFTGVLRGEDLAQAYANMDLFVFPSHTDTFGNVVLEALASGVPALVTPDGGPRYIVRDGETGFVARDEQSGIHPCTSRCERRPELTRSAHHGTRSSTAFTTAIGRLCGPHEPPRLIRN